MITTYEEQANKFIETTGTEFKAEFVGNDFHFDGDKEKRDIYRVTLVRKGREYSFRFGQSLDHSGVKAWNREDCEQCRKSGFKFDREEHRKEHGRETPTAYDVLTCLTKSNPGTIDDFQSEYGYGDEKASKIIKVYNAIVEEWAGVNSLFHDVMEQLREIQ